MAMTPREMVEFFLEQMEGWREGASDAAARGDLHHFMLSTMQIFKCSTMAGLIVWRHDFGDPTDHITAAVAVAGDLVTNEPAGAADLIWQAFPLSYVPYLASLVNRDAEIFMRRLPPPEQALRRPETIETYLNSMLLLAFRGIGSPPDSWLDKVPRRLALVSDTYRCYLRLLTAPAHEYPSLVHQAEDLYRRRARNSYYSGGLQIFGGGPDNGHVVDFILGAILKRIGASGLSEVHGWRW
jgi:hypothetical protein